MLRLEVYLVLMLEGLVSAKARGCTNEEHVAL